MKNPNYISSFDCVEAYAAFTLNCYAFRHDYDVRQGLSLSLGNMVRAFGFALLSSKHINIFGKELSFNQYVKAV